jgi:FkbM family methyltransferase
MPSYNVDVALLCLRDRIHEPPITRLVQECLRQGQVAINVGANFGYYAVLDATSVGVTGRVIAIEANPYIIPYLVENAHLNGYEIITVYHRAAWSRSGEELNMCFAPAYLGGGTARELWSHDFSWRRVAASLDDALWDQRLVETSTDANGRVHADVPVVWFKVPSGTIDEICADVPKAHLLHMDIEGAEAHALHGARKLIERSPDIRIIFEWDSGRLTHGDPAARAMWETTWGWLVEQGFRVRGVNGQDKRGAVDLGPPLTFDYLSKEVSFGNFIAVRPHADAWAA